MFNSAPSMSGTPRRWDNSALWQPGLGRDGAWCGGAATGQPLVRLRGQDSGCDRQPRASPIMVTNNYCAPAQSIPQRGSCIAARVPASQAPKRPSSEQTTASSK